MVRFGLTGIGGWAKEVHIPNLLQVTEAQIAALSSRSQTHLQEAASLLTNAGHSAPQLYTTYEAMLADPNVDAVIICTPNDTHEGASIQALNAGKHVLCEKPLSFSLEGCSRVRQAIDRSGRVFQVGLELRYADVCQKVKELVQAGTVGEPRMVRCLIWRDWGAPAGWRSGTDTSGGIYLELGVHYLDLLDWLVGGGPASIYSMGGQALGSEITDHFWTTVSYASGVHVNLGVCIFSPAENLIPIEVVGEKGRITADVITGQIEIWLRDGAHKDESPRRPPDYHFNGFPGSVESLRAFVRSIQTEERPLAGIDTASRATALALAAGESERSRQPIPVR